MSVVYGVKCEKKYLGGLFSGDTAPVFNIQYKTCDFPLISCADFGLLFGAKNADDIGILYDFSEYDEFGSSQKKIIAVKPSDHVKSGSLRVDPKYIGIFGKNSKNFKCLPMSTPIRAHRSLYVYLSAATKIEVIKEIIIREFRKVVLGMIFTQLYNDMTFEIKTDDGVIKAKVYDVIGAGIVADHTNFWITGCDNITITTELRSKIIKSTKLQTPIESKSIEFKEIYIDEPKSFQLSFDFSKLKVGGLRQQLKEIADVIRPRGINKEHLDKIGMDEFEKGIILYGPPGTGKTTIARELSNALGVEQFVIVNGPELLTKYVGESEANIRRVLENYSDDLKVVFFDEFDCIGKERTGGDGPGAQVANNIVNQILAIMDGVNQKNNILIIAATNRIDVIDPALLRPGRFGLSLYIGLPERKARKDIFQIHLLKNIQQSTLSKSVSLKWLADSTENYSGAEIKGICKKAREIALAEAAPDLSKLDDIDINRLNLETKHFEMAFNHVKCGFAGNGSKAGELLPSGEGNIEAIEAMSDFCTNRSISPRIHTYLLTGAGWTRKSSSCRVICETFKGSFEMILIITNNLINELNKIDLTTGKSILIILDSLENLCGILNVNSYNPKTVEKLNQFVGKVVTGKVILMATMRSSAHSIFSSINPAFEWNAHTRV
jgi:DNA polymerase III delta prime subunit